MIDVSDYLAEVTRIHATGVAQEHAYRPALEKLFRSIADGVTAINEPKGIKVGRPDFVFLRNVGKGADITVGHCEAKDVGLSEQRMRARGRTKIYEDISKCVYPPSPEVFWDVSAKGTALRKLHLMEDAAIGETPYKFTGTGDSVVVKVEYEGGVVRINETQGFEGVPVIAWDLYIGGYQPAQKWLKDRKRRDLSFDDIRHYQKIIKILSETDRIMKTITMPLDGAK